MTKEKIKGKTLILETLKHYDKPMSSTDIWDDAVELGLEKLYAKGTDFEQKKRQICSLLSTWTENNDCPIKRYEKGSNGNSSITYELKKKFKKNLEALNNISSSIKYNHDINELRESDKVFGRPQITTQLRHKLWSNFWNNSMNGLCIVCGEPITITDFVCGHIEAYSINQNSDISNLAPLCNLCNKSMGTMDIREFKRKYHPNIDVPCKIDIFEDYITKEDVIRYLQELTDNNHNKKYLEKAILLLLKEK